MLHMCILKIGTFTVPLRLKGPKLKFYVEAVYLY